MHNQMLNDNHKKNLFVIEDDPAVLDAIVSLAKSLNYSVIPYTTGLDFLNRKPHCVSGCILLDVRMPEMSGIELHDILLSENIKIPVIFMSGHGDIPTAIERVKKGAVDFLVKPLNSQKLIDAINQAFRLNDKMLLIKMGRTEALKQLDKLTAREKEVMDLLCSNHSSKDVGLKLKISPNTVDVHRANILFKLNVRSVKELMLWLFDFGIYSQ